MKNSCCNLRIVGLIFYAQGHHIIIWWIAEIINCSTIMPVLCTTWTSECFIIYYVVWMNYVVFHDLFLTNIGILEVASYLSLPLDMKKTKHVLQQGNILTQIFCLFVALTLYYPPILEFKPQTQKTQNFRYTSNHYWPLPRRLQGANLGFTSD